MPSRSCEIFQEEFATQPRLAYTDDNNKIQTGSHIEVWWPGDYSDWYAGNVKIH